MKKLFKKYGIAVVGFLGAALIFYLILDRDRIAAKYAAAIAGNQILVEAQKLDEARADYYYKENAKLNAKIEESNMNIDLIAAGSRKYQAQARAATAKIAEMQRCEDARMALTVEFDLCKTKVKQITDDFVLQTDNLTLLYDNKIKLKDTEIGELITIKGDLVKDKAELVSKVVKFKASRLRSGTIWFAVGLCGGLLLHAL